MMKLEEQSCFGWEQLQLEKQPLKHSVLQELRWFSQDDANQKVKPPKLSYEMLG